MLPTLKDGDRLLVRWGRAPTSRQLTRGCLVVVDLPPDTAGNPRPLSVKRAVRHDDDGWWVERDSATEGVDSWQVGTLPHAALRAVVVGRLWPRPTRAFPEPQG
ncbi:MAG TPA: hypothetical protein VFL94_13435 [Actinomycetales bacterium]|nr:hypothetical protein [Actinomycetales bacterium]